MLPLPLAVLIPLLANLGLLLADALALAAARRSVVALAIVPLAGVVLTVAGRLALGWNVFAQMQVLAWAGFLHVPLVLAIAGGRWLRLLAALVALVGIDAFFVEPRWLEVTRVRLPGPPLRIALVADLQTDRAGAFERSVIERVNAEKPDLVLFAGDYVHTRDPEVFARNRHALRSMIATLDPPLGAIAVEGDVDDDHDWTTIFEGTGVTVVTRSRAIDLGPLVVTALSTADSRSMNPPIEAQAKFHVALGHAPDFALARPPADLLLAGHTHGGQVRLPGSGPLITFTTVPRAWAAGHTALPWGGDLVVSRGIGLERGDAPRLRFLCRPELPMIELGP